MNALINKMAFIRNTKSLGELTAEQKKLADDIILSLFRLPNAEYIVIGLKGLLELNRKTVKELFLQQDDSSIMKFVENNSYALGLSSIGTDEGNKWLAMWEKE